MLVQKETLLSVDRNITQPVNVNISIALSVNLQHTNVQRSFFIISGLQNILKTT